MLRKCLHELHVFFTMWFVQGRLRHLVCYLSGKNTSTKKKKLRFLDRQCYNSRFKWVQ